MAVSAKRRGLLPCLLYGATGLATGGQVWGLVAWGIWGRPVQAVELVALPGAFGLLVACGLALIRPRAAAWLALAGALAIWPFYGAVADAAIEYQQTRQELRVVFVQWTPGPQSLHLAAGGSGVTGADLSRLAALGVTGDLRVVETARVGEGQPARAVVVVQRQVAGRVDLAQPFRTDVMYVQDDAGWRRVPDDAPIHSRTIRLEPASHTTAHTWYSVELPTGGRSGGTAFIWR